MSSISASDGSEHGEVEEQQGGGQHQHQQAQHPPEPEIADSPQVILYIMALYCVTMRSRDRQREARKQNYGRKITPQAPQAHILESPEEESALEVDCQEILTGISLNPSDKPHLHRYI